MNDEIKGKREQHLLFLVGAGFSRPNLRHFSNL